MKLILSFVLILTVHCLHAQHVGCKITGTLANGTPYRFAYLYYAKENKTIRTPVVLNQFLFQVDQPSQPQVAILFLGTDSLKTYKDAIEERSEIGPKGTRLIAIEDSTMIDIQDNINEGIVTGGNLNKDLNDMYLSSKSMQYEQFFNAHPNSPIALIFLKSLIQISKIPNFSSYVDCKLYYSKLSDSLKNSKEGKKLFKKL